MKIIARTRQYIIRFVVSSVSSQSQITKMTSTVCHRFVQNAWKKERCSNCFKSKEEHVSLKREAPVNKRPLLTASTAKSRGIIKNTIGTPGKRKRTVSFKPELTEIIGFGGEDWSEAEEEDTTEERSSEVRVSINYSFILINNLIYLTHKRK